MIIYVICNSSTKKKILLLHEVHILVYCLTLFKVTSVLCTIPHMHQSQYMVISDDIP